MPFSSCHCHTTTSNQHSTTNNADSTKSINKAVTDRRLRPLCCHLLSHFKRTSFSCRYILRDIMCIRDVMNIQHSHCGLVGPDRGVRKIGPWVWVHWPATGIPTRRLEPSPRLHVVCASISSAATLSCLGLCASMTSSVKPEVHNMSQCRQRRTRPRPYVARTKNW